MSLSVEKIDALLTQAVTALAATRSNYWSFTGNARRNYCHNYFQYPAMMVPEMLVDLMTTVTEIDHSVETVYDPFAGSGTVLTETMLLGRRFAGGDINPLAVLLCKAKSGPFRHEYLTEIADEVCERIREDKSTALEAHFPNREKWFCPEVSIGLSRIRRAIRYVPELWCRRFLWVALAETVRLTSNSRTSTFKLHIRPNREITTRKIDPRNIFDEVVARNLDYMEEFRDALKEKALLRHGGYIHSIKASLKSAASKQGPAACRADLLVTSPSYGDNTTTVPYGQHSYLPLQWIDLNDITGSLDGSCLRTTREIDGRSLGGSRAGILKVIQHTLERTPTLGVTLGSLEKEPIDRRTRVAAFFYDLDKCVDQILQNLRPHAYMIWVIGNRRVGGQQIRADKILSELLQARHASFVCKIARPIPTKRMALKNSVAATMSKEIILLYRNAGGR